MNNPDQIHTVMLSIEQVKILTKELAIWGEGKKLTMPELVFVLRHASEIMADYLGMEFQGTEIVGGVDA